MTPPDIPTPETDAAYIYEMLGVAEPLVRISLARDLERRLAAATAELEEAETRLFDQVEALRSMTGATETETPMFKARALLSELDRLRKEREWQPISKLNKAEMQFALVYQDGAMRASLWNPRGYWETPMVVDEPTHWMPLPDAPKQEEGEA